jgi:hypothetical protein
MLLVCWLSLLLVPRGPKPRKIIHTGYLCLILQSFAPKFGENHCLYFEIMLLMP